MSLAPRRSFRRSLVLAGSLALISGASLPAAGVTAHRSGSAPGATYASALPVENAAEVTVGDDGSATLVGQVGSAFAPAGGAYDDGPQGDIFATRLDATGQTQWAARIGGSREDYTTLEAVDSDGNVYIAGTTRSQDFPTTKGAVGEDYWNGDEGQVSFVLSLSSDGRRLRYAARVPGSLDVNDLVVDQDGAAYLAGRAGTGFPVSDGAYDVRRGTLRSVEGYVAKLSPSGTALAWATYVGGSGDDWPGGLALTRTGDVDVVGNTGSTDLPTTVSVAHPTAPPSDSGQYGFAQRLTDDGRQAAWSTYLAVGDSEYVTGLAETSAGGLDVTGLTESYTGPKARAGDPLPGGWIQQLTPQGDAVRRFETPILGRTVQVPGGAIVGIGHLAGGGDADDAVVRLTENGDVADVIPLPYYGVTVTADGAGSTFVVLETPGGGRTVAARSAGPRLTVTRYAQCTIKGTRGDDVLTGTREPDVICGRGGDDTITALGRYDVVRGGRGADVVQGGRGVDVIGGGPGADRLDGGAGRDLCRDRQGRNVLVSCAH